MQHGGVLAMVGKATIRCMMSQVLKWLRWVEAMTILQEHSRKPWLKQAMCMSKSKERIRGAMMDSITRFLHRLTKQIGTPTRMALSTRTMIAT